MHPQKDLSRSTLRRQGTPMPCAPRETPTHAAKPSARALYPLRAINQRPKKHSKHGWPN